MRDKKSTDEFEIYSWDRTLRFLDRLLKECTLRKGRYERARRRALARKPFLNTDGHYLSREEVHDRVPFR
jgi:hypothetical protein